MDANAWIAAAGLFIGVALGVVRYVDGIREKHRDDQRNADVEARKQHEQENKALAERLRLQELAQRTTEGDLRVLAERHNGHQVTITELRQQMVPRSEWESRMDSLEGTTREIEHKIDRFMQAAAKGMNLRDMPSDSPPARTRG